MSIQSAMSHTRAKRYFSKLKKIIDQKKLKKALIVHDITVPMIAEAANVSESTVYRWIAHPERMNIGTVDLIKDLTKMDKTEFNSIFYPEIVA